MMELKLDFILSLQDLRKCNMIIKKLIKKYCEFIKILAFGLNISWSSSKWITLTRLTINIFTPTISTMTMFIFKKIIDLFIDLIQNYNNINNIKMK